MTEATDGAAPEAVTEDTTLEPQVEAEVSGEDAAAAVDDEGQAEQPKPKKSAQERIAELTAKMRAEEREKEYWREQATARPQPATQPAAQPKADDEPDPATYDYGEDDRRFIRDHAAYVAKKTVREEMAQQSAQASLQSQLATFEQRLAQQYPDGEPDGVTALRRAQALPTAVQDVILASENGPKLADHLGSNPAELRRLSGLTPALQAYELAKLEAKLTTRQAKTTTTAPEPIPQVRGSGGQFKAAPDTDDFASFEKAYP